MIHPFTFWVRTLDVFQMEAGKINRTFPKWNNPPWNQQSTVKMVVGRLPFFWVSAYFQGGVATYMVNDIVKSEGWDESSMAIVNLPP